MNTVDSRCFELADVFIDELPLSHDIHRDILVRDLAEAIQNTIESWLADKGQGNA